MTTASLRPASTADLELLRTLDDDCFDDPWSAQLWRQMLSNGRRYSCWLLEAEQPLGFILFSHVLDEAELMRIGVRPSARGEGLARRMLEQAQGWLETKGIVSFYLEVRASNIVAQQLYRRCGWQQEGVRRNYYPAEDGSEDALLFNRQLD